MSGYLNGDSPTASEELKKLGGEVHNALTALRDSTETKNKETIDKVESFFKKYDDENAKFATAVALHTKELNEFKEKVAAAETKLAEAVKGTAEYEGRAKSLELIVATMGKKSTAQDDTRAQRDTPEYKSFMHWLSYDGKCSEFKGVMTNGGIQAPTWDPTSLDYKVLRTDSESAGGYLIPQVMDNMIRKNIIEMSPVRQHAKNRTMPSKTMDVPRRLSVPIAQYEGEAEDSPSDQSIYGSEQVTAYRQTVTVPATLDMMVSSAFDLEREIASDVGESFAQGEGRNFVLGNGRKSPQGFMVDSRVVGFTSSTSGNFTIDDLSNMEGKLKRGQAPWWYFNRKTLAYIRTLKSSIGVPIWQPMAGNNPASIWGVPYSADMIDMDDVSSGTGAKPVALADLYRGYEIFDMIGMNVIRDDLTQKKKAITEWTFRRYNTGRVILPEAICVMTLL